MGDKRLRVSEETWELLRAAAEAEQRTMAVVLERLVRQGVSMESAGSLASKSARETARELSVMTPKPPKVVPAPKDRAGMTGDLAAIWKAQGRCPQCGCSPVSHRKGALGNRCEAHPTCMWREVPA